MPLPALRLRLLLLPLALWALLGAAVAHPAGAAPQPNPFVGIVSEDAFAGTPAYRQDVLRRIAGLGAGTVRQTLDWALVEPSPGRSDWTTFDGWVGANARAGIRVLPVVFNPPGWASKRPARHALRGTYPPRSNAAFAAFAAAAAGRYGTGGTFWAAHPEVPALPITSWQIWNEPNLPVYWQPKPKASAYVALLRATSRAVKRVDPAARILTAGLPKSRIRGAVGLTTYVRQMYAAHGAGAFDALAVNPYARTAAGVLGFLRQMRTLMNARGDRGGQLWATEIGWSDKGPGGSFRLGAAGQAKAIRTVLPSLWKARSALRLQGVLYFNWRDARPYPGGKDFWGLHTGLLSLSGAPKPAFGAFRDAVAGLR
jgi:hypothetical protein